jgi:tight adherence protein B
MSGSSATTTARRRRSLLTRALWASFCVTILGLGLWSMPSGADTLVPGQTLRAVDARSGDLQVYVSHPGITPPKGITVQVGDKTLKPTAVTPLDQLGEGANVMVVVDNSAAVGNGAVQFTKDALSQFEPGAGVESLGVVTTGGAANLAARPSSSLDSVDHALDQIAPVGSSALLQGIEEAANTFTEPGAQNAIVVVAGSPDHSNDSRISTVLEAVRESGASVHVVGLAGGSADLGQLQQIVETAGGSLQVGGSDQVSSMFHTVRRQLDGLFRITVPTSSLHLSNQDLTPITVNWASESTVGAFQAGALTMGADALQPLETDGILDSFFASPLARWIILGLGFASAAMIVYAIGMLVIRRNDGLDFALRHYESYATEEPTPTYEDDDHSLAKGAMLKKAVAITGDLAQRQGLLAKVEDMLERADLPLRPAEAVFFYLAVVVALTALTAGLSRNIFMVIAVLILSLLVPKYVLQFKGARRNKKFVRQLPDMLQLLSGTLRAGYSVAQGFEAVSQEIEDPMGKELQLVMGEARLGRPLEEALDNAAQRMKSDDFTWAVMAIRIQREVGGNLAELLMTVSETMTQRERLRRDVSALTAEGRMSAIVLGILPPGLALVMYVTNPGYIGRLTQDSIGMILLCSAVVMMLIGFAWMRKIINIEI